MAYVQNVASFLDACIHSNQKYGVYNYVDTPDFTMEQLVSCVRLELLNKSGVGVRVPYWFGWVVGSLADLVSFLFRKKISVSALRVKKFVASSEFGSAKSELDNFQAPFELKDGLQRTLISEFISPDPSREIFYTE
jgi:hypothetical protein